MRTIRHKRVKIIHAPDAEQFEIRINRTLERFPEAEIRFNDALGFCAYIIYEYDEDIPEDVREEFHQKGIYYHCRNCPRMEPPRDGRFKMCFCDITPHGKTHMDQDACEWFYKALLTGEIRRSELIRD